MWLLDVFEDFAGGTSIHGLTFLIQSKLSAFTRITWAFVFIGAMVYASFQLKLAVICKFRPVLFFRHLFIFVLISLECVSKYFYVRESKSI